VVVVHAVPSILAIAPAKNPVPVIVTTVPPPTTPRLGRKLLTVGAGKNV
jgi:hypothetical protein